MGDAPAPGLAIGLSETLFCNFTFSCERSRAGLPGCLFCIFHIRSALVRDLKQAGDSDLDRYQTGRVVPTCEHMCHNYTIAGAISHGSTEAGSWDFKS